MNYYYVDYENVNNNGLEGIENLEKKDMVNILYSANANTMNMETVKKLRQCKATIKFVDVKCLGRNALDFQLCVLLGSRIGKFRGKQLNTYIVSKDHGYDSVKNGINIILSEELRKKDIQLCISRIEKIKTSFNEEETSSTIEQKNPICVFQVDIPNVVKNKLKGTGYEKHINSITKLLEEQEFRNMSEFHNECCKRYGKEKGREIYQLLKKSLKYEIK